ncbi:NAD+ synthase [Candidiatus Paracoxiella cheracis]|uniref:NAD+ synthase n=1 Tax=Candidiatus Paracoxiella cheracis TaxID=3405120 RepID=UPI003BF5E6BE
MKKLTVVAAQIDLLVGDIEGNADRIIESAKKAYHDSKADLIMFPELAITSYPPEDLLLRPGLYRRVHNALKKIAENVKHGTLIVGYPDQIEGKRYNKAAIIQNGEVITSYAKQELPNYTVFDEKRYFEAGHEPCVIKIKGVNVGIIICEDLWHDEPIHQSIQAGAEIIACINASPFAQDKAHARRDLLTLQATKTNVPIIYLNLIGGQDELVFDGGSMVFDQHGKLAQQAPYFEENLMTIEFDLEHNFDILTKHASPAEPLDEEKIYKILVLGVRDYIQKNGFPGAIIGLSGGVDSALTLAIAVDAIGADNVSVLLMPSRHTSEISMEDAIAEADTLKVHYSIIEIEPVFEAFLNSLAAEFSGLPKDVTEENLQARIRGILLMSVSNKKGAIVLTTGNKSEIAVGYTTLYGDMAGGFGVLKDVYKTMVYRLCKYRNTLSPVIPDRVLEKPPSAELAENQKDQDTLPPYHILDEILERYIAKDEDPYTIADAGFDLKVVKKVIKMVNRNEYKRRQAPVGIRITQRAFGKDRRYPITSGFTKDY